MAANYNEVIGEEINVTPHLAEIFKRLNELEQASLSDHTLISNMVRRISQLENTVSEQSRTIDMQNARLSAHSIMYANLKSEKQNSTTVDAPLPASPVPLPLVDFMTPRPTGVVFSLKEARKELGISPLCFSETPHAMECVTLDSHPEDCQEEKSIEMEVDLDDHEQSGSISLDDDDEEEQSESISLDDEEDDDEEDFTEEDDDEEEDDEEEDDEEEDDEDEDDDEEHDDDDN